MRAAFIYKQDLQIYLLLELLALVLYSHSFPSYSPSPLSVSFSFYSLEDQIELPQDLIEERKEDANKPGLPEIITMPSRFEQKQEKGFIDVWWLYDDGGRMIVPVYLEVHLLLLTPIHNSCLEDLYGVQ